MTFHEIIETESWKNFTSKLEKIGALLVLIGLSLYYIKGTSNILLILGFSTLAVVYFIMGFKELEPGNVLASTFFKIQGWGLAISCASILFTLMGWPINQNSLIVSMVLILVSILLGFKFRTEANRNLIGKIYFLRSVVALLLLCFIYFSKIFPG
jgi:hypothetical protein